MKTLVWAVLLSLNLVVLADDAPRLFRVQKDGKEGFINQEGKVIVPLQEYVWLGQEFSEGLVEARTKSGYLFFDESGKVKLELGNRYGRVGAFKDGLARVQKGYLYGFIVEQ